MAWSLKSYAELNLARFGRSIGSGERALELARRAGDEWEEARVLGFLSMSVSLGPTPVGQAIIRCEELLANLEGRRGHMMGIAGDLAWLRAMRGEFDEARRLYRRCQKVAGELTIALGRASLSQVAGDVELLAGTPERAEGDLRAGYEELENAGEVGVRATVAAVLARVLEAQDRFEEADRFTSESEQIAAEDDVLVQIDWRGTRSRLLATAGAFEAAEALAREGIAIARATDALNTRGDASLALATVLARAGKRGRAADAAKDAIAEYTAKENLVSVSRAEALLSALV